jgi:uncharacterized zinc-type alcohol dehydrogenase-like protein
MCERCDDYHHLDVSPRPVSRRSFIASAAVGGGVLASSGAGGPARPAFAAEGGAKTVKAYGHTGVKSGMVPLAIERRAPRPDDVQLEILYCGVCHSDIHTVRGEWGPQSYPLVPGHEIVGRVTAVGDKVAKFKVGDTAGVGCMVDSCGRCESCKRGWEQYCTSPARATFTYGSPDADTKRVTQGGYSKSIVVKEGFVIRIPKGMDLASAAPLLCAGVTTFSPLQRWKVKAGQRVGVAGLGGLGHVAVKLAVAREAEVVVFTTSPGKIDDAKKMGAKGAVLSTNAGAMKKHAGTLDLVIATIPRPYPVQPYLDLLRLDGTLVNVGAMENLDGKISGAGLARGRKSLAGSIIGGVAETQEVVDYCARRKIKPDVEIIKIRDINKAFDRVVAKDVRYRFVIDMASL